MKTVIFKSRIPGPRHMKAWRRHPKKAPSGILFVFWAFFYMKLIKRPWTAAAGIKPSGAVAMALAAVLLLYGQAVSLSAAPGGVNVNIQYFSSADNGFHHRIWSVTRDLRGLMYFANQQGVLEFDSRFWRLIPVPGGGGAYSLATGPRGRVYVGGEGEIGYLEAHGKGTLRFRSLKEKIPAAYRDFRDRVIKIEVTPEGLIFLTDKLLFVLRKESPAVLGTSDHFFTFLYTRDSLYVIDGLKGLLELRGGRLAAVPGGDFLRAHVMLPSGDNTLLLVTPDGVPVRFDPSGRTPPVYPSWSGSRDFFSDNLVNCGMWLDHDRIVLGSIKKGVMMVDITSGKILYPHGGSGGDLRDSHVYGVYPAGAGNLWAALEQGVSLMSFTFPGKAPEPLAIKALIRRCETFSHDDVIFDGTFYDPGIGVPRPDQPEHQILTFPFDNNAFRFIFTSNHYRDIEKNRFQCYLGGLDRSWTSWSDRVYREYTNLDWGNYTFHVRTINSAGETGGTASYSFRIEPPWHETWWFAAVQIAFIIGVLIASRVVEELGGSPKIAEFFIIFGVLVIFGYFNALLTPLIGKYSRNIVFFKITVMTAISLALMPTRLFLQKVLKKIIKKKKKD